MLSNFVRLSQIVCRRHITEPLSCQNMKPRMIHFPCQKYKKKLVWQWGKRSLKSKIPKHDDRIRTKTQAYHHCVHLIWYKEKQTLLIISCSCQKAHFVVVRRTEYTSYGSRSTTCITFAVQRVWRPPYIHHKPEKQTAMQAKSVANTPLYKRLSAQLKNTYY